MSASSFTKKAIKTEVEFASGGSYTFEGLATMCAIQKPGLPTRNTCKVLVYGLEYEKMAELTTGAPKPLETDRDIIRVSAGDEGGTMSLAFEGEITPPTYPDFNRSPDIPVIINAESGYYPTQIAESPYTVDGELPAEDLFQLFSSNAGYDYKNEGVSSSVLNSWFSGSPIDKLVKLSQDVNCNLIIDDGQVVTTPVDSPREGQVITLSRDTGLIGYPSFNQDGIEFSCIYNPNLVYGTLVEIESIVPKASGKWMITSLNHKISCYIPMGGPWQTDVKAAYSE